MWLFIISSLLLFLILPYHSNAAPSYLTTTLLNRPYNIASVYGNATERTVYLQARAANNALITSGGDLFQSYLITDTPSCQPNIATPYCIVTCAPLITPHIPSPACISSITSIYQTYTQSIYQSATYMSSQPAYVPVSITDLTTGVYSLTFSPEWPATYALYVWGLTQGGLTAQYYENVWFLNDPAVNRIDETINFDWGSGALTPAALDYVSIRWTGALKSNYTESYTIYALADDWIRVWLDKRLIIDAWSGGCCTEYWATVSLTQGFMHDLIIEYAELRANASIKLSWKSFSTPKTVIPSSAYYWRTPILNSPFKNIQLGPGDPASSTTSFVYDDAASLSPKSGLSSCVAGQKTSVYLQLVDVFGNYHVNQTSNMSSISITLSGPDASPSISLSFVGNGLYVINYTVIVTGNYSLAIRLNGNSIKRSPFSITALPATTLASNTLIYGVSGTGQAGVTSALFIQLKDLYGNNRTSVGLDTIYVAWNNLGTLVAYQALLSYVGSGLYRSYFTPSVSGSYAVSVYVNGGTVGSSPYAVVISTGTGLAISSTASGVGLTQAVAGVPSSFGVSPRDQFGNFIITNCCSFTYTITNSLNAIVSSGSLSWTSASSTYNASYTISNVGKFSLTISGPGSGVVAGSPFSVSVIPGTASVSATTLLGTAPTAAFSGQAMSFQAVAHDANGNLVNVGGLSLTATLTCGGTTVTGSVIDLANGYYNFSITPTIANAACSMHVMSTLSVDIVNSPFVVLVRPGVASASTTTATGSLASGVAGQTGSITVRTYDSSGNTISIGGSLIKVIVTPSVAVTSADLGTGLYSFQYTPVLSGSYSIAVLVITQGGLLGRYFNDQAFSSFFGSRVDSSIDFSWSGVSPMVSMSMAYYSVQWEGQIKAPNTGAFTFYLTGNADTGVALMINGTSVISSLNSLTGSSLRFGSIALSANTMYPITLQLTTLGSGGSIKFSWSCAAIFSIVPVPSTALYHVDAVSGSPFTATILPSASVASTSSWITDLTNPSALVANIPFHITVQLRDINNNLQSLTTEAGLLSSTLVTNGTTITSTFTTTGVGGQYTTPITPTDLGSALLRVTFNGIAIGSTLSLSTAPGAVSATNCIVTTALGPSYSGVPASITIQVRDSLNHNLLSDVTSASLTFAVTMTSTYPATISPVISYVGNGQYMLSYTAVIAATYSLVVSLGSTAIAGSPFVIIIQPGQASPARTTVSTVSDLTVNTLGTITTITLADGNNNLLTTGGYQLVTRATAKASPTTIIRGVAVDHGDGTYGVMGISSLTGEYVGTVKLVAGTGIGNSGAGSGLLGSYYNNRWMSGTPVLIRVDPLISFDYGTDSRPVAITPTARNYVSVIWSGYLRISTAANITFSVSYADGARLTVDNNILFDRFTGPAGLQSTFYVFPTSDVLYDIKLEYRHDVNIAYVQLNWSSIALGIDNQPIPTTNLYPQATTVQTLDFFVN